VALLAQDAWAPARHAEEGSRGVGALRRGAGVSVVAALQDYVVIKISSEVFFVTYVLN
jgi:hypothetical protein